MECVMNDLGRASFDARKLARISVSIALGLLLFGPWAGPATAEYEPAGYHLSYAENFNGNDISDTSFRYAWTGYSGSSNTTDAVSVADGKLALSIYTTGSGGGAEHWGGAVSTDSTYAYSFGYTEARIKFNNSQGGNLAYWLLSDAMVRDPGGSAKQGIEIDIIEQRQTDGNNNPIPDMFHIALHAGGYGDDNYSHYPSNQPSVENLADTWHTIGCLWTNSGYTFYCDGVEKWSYHPTWLQDLWNGKFRTDGPEWMVFTADPQGGWCGDLLADYGSPETSETVMTIDYCRVYQSRPMSWNLGNGGSGTWNAANTNWNYTDGGAGQTFTIYDEVYFRGNGGTITIAGGFTAAVTGLHFESDGYTITGSTLNLGRCNIICNPDVTTTINSTITGTKGLTFSGEGTLVLGGNNSYSGDTLVKTGSVLNIRHANALGDTNYGTRVRPYAALQIQGGITTANEPLTLSGTGIAWTGALRNVSGNNTYSGLITLDSNVRIWTASDSLTLSNAGTITGDGNDLEICGSGNTTINSVIGTGSGGLAKSGSGTLTLTRANTYTGLTTVGGGTLAYGINNVIASGAVTVNGGTLDLGSYSDTVGAVTLNGGSITGTGTLTSTGNYTLTSGTANIILAGGGSLTKTGAGTATLAKANTYTGTTIVSEGTLAYGTNNVIAGGAVTVNDATLNLGSYSDTVGAVTLNGGSITGTGMLTSTGNYTLTSGTANIILAGSGSLTKTGAGTATLAKANTYTGTTVVSEGTLVSNVVNAIPGSVAVTGGTLDLGNLDKTISSLYFSGGTITGTGSLSISGNTMYVSGGTADIRIVGNISVAKNSSSTTTFTSSNAYTGTTNITNGSLRILHANGLGSTASGTAVQSGGTLELAGGITTANEALVINGTGHNNAGALRNISGNNNYAGTVTLGSNSRINSDSGQLYLSNGTITGSGKNLTFDGSGNIAVNSHIGTGSGTVTKNGSGTLALLTSSTYTGTTNINTGTVLIQSPTSLGTTANGTTVANGATLRIQGTNAIAESLTLGGVGVGNGGVLRNIGGNNTVSGAITFNTYGVRINSDSGTLTLNSGTPTGGSCYYLDLGGSGNITINTAIDTSVSILTKDGSGTVLLTGNNTYTGRTRVEGGVLRLHGSDAKNRALTAGGCDIQKGEIVFDYAIDSSTIDTLLTASYEYGDWNVGQFRCTTSDAYHGLGWLDDGSNDVTVRYVVYGDANLDGYVNATDLAIVQSNMYTQNPVVWSDGDFNYDGYVNQTDLDIVTNNQDMYQSMSIKVPEPSTLALLATGLIGLLAYAWRRRK